MPVLILSCLEMGEIMLRMTLIHKDSTLQNFLSQWRNPMTNNILECPNNSILKHKENIPNGYILYYETILTSNPRWSSGYDFRLSSRWSSAGDRGSIPRRGDFFLIDS